MKSYTTKKSGELYKRAMSSLAGGVSANSRGPLAGFKPYPIFMERGLGPRLYDVDGNEYIDYVCGFGCLILGHRHPKVIGAAKRALDEQGSLFGTPYALEGEVAAKIVQGIPSMELVRFPCTGGEAVREALRVAKVATGKQKVVRFEGHFHGLHEMIHFSHHPSLEAAGPEDEPRAVPSAGGISEAEGDTLVIQPWNKPEVLERTIAEHKDEIAAVITEPVMANTAVIPPGTGYLQFLRDITARNGILLIFDEVKTGFRLAFGGAQEYYSVRPDLTVFGKAIAGGLPGVSGMGGKRELMELIAEGKVWQSGTYCSNLVGIAAAAAVIQELEQPGFFEGLNLRSQRLASGLEAILQEAGVVARVQRVGSILQILFSDRPITNYRDAVKFCRLDQFATFFDVMVRRGLYFHPSQFECWFVSAAHTDEHIDQTLERVKGAMPAFKEALAKARAT